MLSKNIFISCVLAFTAFTSASPLQKRAITVFTDTSSASITPAIATVAQPDDIGGKADIADAIAGIVDKVTTLIQGLIDNDIKRRQRFTQETVSAVAVQFPGSSVVMSNVDYTISCAPAALQHASYRAKVGSNVSFDVLAIGAGCTFTLNGDGGFENWAYILKSPCKANGKTITC